MPSRRGGSRSHTGCEECKRRHVKCDETGLVCGQCRRNGRACSRSARLPRLDLRQQIEYKPLDVAMPFQWVQVNSEQIKAGPMEHATIGQEQRHDPQRARTSIPWDNSDDELHLPAYARTHSQRDGDSNKNATFSVLTTEELVERASLAPAEQELFQHFINSTAQTLNECDEILPLFKSTAPLLAITRPYLMYAILAMAGTHRLVSRALPKASASLLQERVLDYQARSLEIYSENINKASSTDDCVATCLACIFVLLFALASPHTQPVEPYTTEPWALNRACQLLRLQAGIKAIFWSRHRQIESSALRILLVNYSAPFAPQPLDSVVQQSFAKLQMLCSSPSLSEGHRQTYACAIGGLQAAFHAVSQNACDAGNRLGWVRGDTASSLADLVEARKPEALLVLAHWAVILEMGEKAWWKEGFGRSLVEDIGSVLPSEYKAQSTWVFG